MNESLETLGNLQKAPCIAIDLGAESCRVSLLRWKGGKPEIQLIHRFANSPVHRDGSLRWPLEAIQAGVEEGVRKAGECAPEGIHSIAVDGWAVDYLRLGADGKPRSEPFCYRDERTLAAKHAADALAPPQELFRLTGAQPLRLNTVYQLLADPDSGIDPQAPWLCLPEYILHWLGGRRVAEFTNATHTGLVDIETGNWSRALFERLGIPFEAAPPIVPAGSILGHLQGPLAALPTLRDTILIAPACHDTASAIAGIPTDLQSTAYICSGTWSLVGTLVAAPLISREALEARYTNQGAAGGGFCFHTNVNGMWTLKQCMDGWRERGRAWEIEELVKEAAGCKTPADLIDVDAAPLLLDGPMPARINDELKVRGLQAIPDIAGNEPLFARLIFESLASRYASAIHQLEEMLNKKLDGIHILGGGSRNQLLTALTAQRTGLPVESGQAESSTIGNFAVQLAAGEARGMPITREAIRRWAKILCNNSSIDQEKQS